MNCRRFQSGTPIKVSYEHVQLAPSDQVAQKVVENSLEGAMVEAECGEKDHLSARKG